jgi:hypothetical protein
MAAGKARDRQPVAIRQFDGAKSRFLRTANDYSSYMKRNGIWGSYLEAGIIAKILGIPLLIWNKNSRRCYDILNYRPGINTCASTIHIIYSNGNHYDALIFQGSSLENEQMTLSIIGDRSTSATRPHSIQSSVDNAANGTLLSDAHCNKRKFAVSTQDSLPVGKRLHSQSIRILQSAYNKQLTSNQASKDRISMNKRQREECPSDNGKVSPVSRILGKPVRQKFVHESTLGNAHVTKSSYNCDLNQTGDLPYLIRIVRPYPPTPLNQNIGTRRISIRDERILKRLAPDGCNTLTRRPQKRRRAMP